MQIECNGFVSLHFAPFVCLFAHCLVLSRDRKSARINFDCIAIIAPFVYVLLLLTRVLYFISSRSMRLNFNHLLVVQCVLFFSLAATVPPLPLT